MLALTLAAALAAGPAEVVVGQGESLAEVAKRSLGDTDAACELKALNGLKSDHVSEGTSLRLPGPERSRALSALAAARNAVNQTESPQREQASAGLKNAERLFRAARYGEAAAAADGAWRLVSSSAPENTRFAVEVDSEGHTEVSSLAGQPVRVEHEGVTRPVHPGQNLTVAKGEPLAPPHTLLNSPVPTAPSDFARLKLRPTDKGLGPISVAWEPVAGASHYLVELLAVDPAGEKRLTFKVDRAEARLPLLPAGRYVWSVRALGPMGSQSDRSPPRTFELAPEALKLEVQGTQWK